MKFFLNIEWKHLEGSLQYSEVYDSRLASLFHVKPTTERAILKLNNLYFYEVLLISFPEQCIKSALILMQEKSEYFSRFFSPANPDGFQVDLVPFFQLMRILLLINPECPPLTRTEFYTFATYLETLSMTSFWMSGRRISV